MTQPRSSYMAVARFRDDVSIEDIRALIPAEQAQAAALEDKGLLGVIHVAMPKRTVFIELFDTDEAGALTSLESLPLAALWDAELYETTPPAGSAL